MEEQHITFETAKLAKEKGFNIEGILFYEIPSGNLINFKDKSSQEFIDDCESGYRDKGLNYFKEAYFGTYNNIDREDSEVLASTQSLLQKWLREIHNIHVEISYDIDNEFGGDYIVIVRTIDRVLTFDNQKIYEDALEIGLQESLKLI